MYHIKVLTSDEFDKVAKSDPRYSRVDGDNLGFADPLKNTAYVRFSAYPELNKYLIDHEFEHLLESHGTDEDEFGIRHKKGKKFFKDIFLPMGTLGLSKLNSGNKEQVPQDAQMQLNQLQQQTQPDLRQGQANPFSLFTPSQVGQSVSGSFSNPQLDSTTGSLSQGLNTGYFNNQSDPFSQFRYGAPSGRFYF